MPEDIAYTPLLPYDKELAKILPKIPFIPVGFEYFSTYKEMIATGGTCAASHSYTVPKNKILFITDAHLSLYIDNFYSGGTQGKGYVRITTNDAIFSYIAMLMIKGNRQGTTCCDSSDSLSLNFPMPLRIPSGTVVTFCAEKSSCQANSIVWGNVVMHGYLLKK